MKLKDDSLLPFERRLTTHTEEDVFIMHLQGILEFEKMSPTLQKRFNRLSQCRDYIREWGSRHKVVPMLISDFGISESQAYKDFNSCIKIFNAAADTDGRDFWVDILMGKLTETWKKSIADRDFRAAEKTLKTMKDAIKDFFGNNEAKLYADLQPPVLITKYIPNEKLPENWKEQALKIIGEKKRKREDIDISDAEIISENDEPTDEQ